MVLKVTQCHRQGRPLTKGKAKGHGHCDSAAYMSRSSHRERFTTSEVTCDWHELMVLQRMIRPCIACANRQLDS